MNLGAMQAERKKRKRKADHTSALLGSLWLLRSRPDQVHDIHMRGDPQSEILTEFKKKAQLNFHFYLLLHSVFLPRAKAFSRIRLILFHTFDEDRYSTSEEKLLTNFRDGL